MILSFFLDPGSTFKYNSDIFILKIVHCKSKKKEKVKLSRYTPWRHMGGEEV
jgi:hypothetical protein